MGRIEINYEQMLAARQVYSDVHKEIIDSINEIGGHSSVIDVFERGVPLLIHCEETRVTYRCIGPCGAKLMRLNDILSIAVVGDASQIVVDKMKSGDLVVTLIGKTSSGPMRAVLRSPHAYGIRVTVAAVISQPHMM